MQQINTEDELLEFILTIIRNSHKCQHCIHCAQVTEGPACVMGYECIANDFSEFDRGD